MGERRIVDDLRRLAGRNPKLTLGIGDDCAIHRPSQSEDLLFTTDLLIENIHFHRDTHSPEDCGWKALARGLSDIAAMGGKPLFCLVSLGAPNEKWIRAFYRGLLKLAKREGCTLAGGDLSKTAQVVCDIVVIGSVPKGKALRRDGAQPGDGIYVSGVLGESAFGLEYGRGKSWMRHLRPQPRIELGLALRSRKTVTAAMDLSDGLSIDLARLLEASNVSADLDGQLPAYSAATVEQALHGGEDYELLFTSSGKVPAIIAGLPITRIGTVRKGKAGEIRIAGQLLQPRGWDHFA